MRFLSDLYDVLGPKWFAISAVILVILLLWIV